MINVKQLRNLVVRPVLETLASALPRIDSPAAEELLLGTLVHESTVAGETYLKQIPRGPALSVYQIEPTTYDWLDGSVLERDYAYYPRLRDAIYSFCADPGNVEELTWNMAAATCYARLRYWVVPDGLPAWNDVEGLATYWGKHYQTQNDERQKRHWVKMYLQHVRPSARGAW